MHLYITHLFTTERKCKMLHYEYHGKCECLMIQCEYTMIQCECPWYIRYNKVNTSVQDLCDL